MICILLATCNGERFLPEFLDSLDRQSLSDWQLLIRDDGSTDGTPAILEAAARRDPRVVLIRDTAGRLGAAQNFGALLQHARRLDAEYAFFADQDDVWQSHKLEHQLTLVQQAEAACGGPQVPCLLHTDLTVVNEYLDTLHPSLAGQAGVAADRAEPSPLRLLLSRNFVTGCASVVNRSLMNVALPFPASVVMHDWWTALCAASFGHVQYVPEPLVLYRQHSGNLVGAVDRWQYLRRIGAGWIRYWKRTMNDFERGVQQARALNGRLREHEEQGNAAELVESYCRLFDPEHSAWTRFAGMRRLGVNRSGLLGRMALAARLLGLSNQPADDADDCPVAGRIDGPRPLRKAS